LLWLVYQRTRQPQLAALAQTAGAELARMMTDERFHSLDHDVGFQFLPTAVMHYKLTGDPVARRHGLLAAALLMSRFNAAGNVIEAWNGEHNRGKVIIDTLMNLPLLYWAAQETGLDRYRHVADAHARTILQYFVRPDGSVHHILRFDPEGGTVVEALGGQGYSPDSAWSRGQAWALTGFAVAARDTGNEAYLSAARCIADAFLAALSPEAVPPWDLRAPERQTAPRDSSAGAIAASGLLELAHLLPESQGAGYAQAARHLLQKLHERCATVAARQADGLLRHATGNLPAGRDIDVSLIYGDYYFFEALGKLNQNLLTIW
jgi:unsaturated chondroitin disaccharide hydrolase